MLSSAFGEGNVTAWQVTSKDKKKAAVLLVRTLAEANAPWTIVRLRDLKEDALYTDLQNGNRYYGDELMYKGFFPSLSDSDFASLLIEFEIK